jgi:glycine cleavage system aminomethyltransferase T
MGKSLAFARLQPDVAVDGAELRVVGDAETCTATVTPFPIYDPDKERRRT